MSNLDKSIDNNAIKGVMYLEQAISAIDNLYTLYYIKCHLNITSF